MVCRPTTQTPDLFPSVSTSFDMPNNIDNDNDYTSFDTPNNIDNDMHKHYHNNAHDNLTYEINNATCFVSKHSTHPTNKGALIDHGANGGLAGADVQITGTIPNRFVDVQGVDNHQLPNIPIVTAEGVVQTQRGPVILIMHQCAHLPHGKTTHSSAQLESHGVIVDDKAI